MPTCDELRTQLAAANSALELASDAEAKLALSYQVESARYYALLLQGAPPGAINDQFIVVTAVGAAWQLAILNRSYRQWSLGQIQIQIAMGGC